VRDTAFTRHPRNSHWAQTATARSMAESRASCAVSDGKQPVWMQSRLVSRRLALPQIAICDSFVMCGANSFGARNGYVGVSQCGGR
jgi:hypothetical protein